MRWRAPWRDTGHLWATTRWRAPWRDTGRLWATTRWRAPRRDTGRLWAQHAPPPPLCMVPGVRSWRVHTTGWRKTIQNQETPWGRYAVERSADVLGSS